MSLFYLFKYSFFSEYNTKQYKHRIDRYENIPSHRTAEKSSSRFRHILQNLRLNRDISDHI